MEEYNTRLREYQTTLEITAGSDDGMWGIATGFTMHRDMMRN